MEFMDMIKVKNGLIVFFFLKIDGLNEKKESQSK